MYECFHCLSRSVIWDADFDTEDYGYEPGGGGSRMSLRKLRCNNHLCDYAR